MGGEKNSMGEANSNKKDKEHNININWPSVWKAYTNLGEAMLC